MISRRSAAPPTSRKCRRPGAVERSRRATSKLTVLRPVSNVPDGTQPRFGSSGGGFVGVGVDEVGALVDRVVGEVGGVSAVGWPVLVFSGAAGALAEPGLHPVQEHRQRVAMPVLENFRAE